MQRIARLLVVVLVLSMLDLVPARAQGSIAVSVEVFLGGNTLSTGCKPPASLGAPTVHVGASTMLLKDGAYTRSGDSPTQRAGCLYFVAMNVLEAERHAVSVGDTEIGEVSADELRSLDNHLQIAIDISDLTIESEDWRFPGGSAGSTRPIPTPTVTPPARPSNRHAPSQHQTTPVPTATTAATATATAASRSRTSDRWGCADLQDYQDEMFALLRSVDEVDAVERFIEADDFTTLRPSVLLRASSGLDEWAGLLEEMDDVPLAAQEYHQNMIDYASLTSVILVSYANGGLFAVVPYSDAMDTITSERDAASRLGERRCGDEWTDVFGS